MQVIVAVRIGSLRRHVTVIAPTTWDAMKVAAELTGGIPFAAVRKDENED